MHRRDFLAASALSLARTAAGDTVSQHRHIVENGFICAGGQAGAGWYAGVITLDHQETAYCEGPHPGPDWSCLYNGEPFETEFEKARRWREAVVNLPRQLVLRTQAEPDRDRKLATAERILGPAAPATVTARPALVWTERKDTQWLLRFFDGSRVQQVYSAGGILRSPAVAHTARGFAFACERDGDSGPEALLLDENGIAVARLAGSRPRLAASQESIFVLVQRSQRNSISTRVIEIRERRVVGETEVPARDDYTWNGDLSYDPDSRRLLVVVESCPAFGMDEQLGQYRQLYSWAMPPEKASFAPWPGNGRVPAECLTFDRRSAPPLLPRLLRLDGKPAIAFRQYRFLQQSGGSGWDVWVASAGESRWEPPMRMSENCGPADTGFALLERPGGSVGVFPCRQHPPMGAVALKYWVEIVDVPRRPEFPSFVAPESLGRYPATTGVRDISVDPGLPESPPAGLQLIYGDLHQHSAYSTCQPSTNGMPEDSLRFHRDVLGCQVLTLTEHGHHMIEPESIYVLDRIEEFAGDRSIVVYGDEPNPQPGRHTNFFTIRRDVFEELRTIFLSHGRGRSDVYRHIKNALPRHSVLAIRHFHGALLRGDALRGSFDPELEVAMEAMQVRLNAMLQVTPESKGTLFPNDCLDLGLRVGLVGGTDHTSPSGDRLNTFCLTGFWVRERTAEGVFEALRARRTTAMSNGKIAIWATLAGHPMGSDVTVEGKVTVRAGFSCGRRIVRAGLMRDGKILQWIPIGGKRASLEFTDPEPPHGYHWYVVTAEMETAYKQPGYGHASPFFVTVRA